MTQHQNDSVTEFIEILLTLETEISEEDVIHQFKTSKDSLNEILKCKNTYKKHSEDCLKNLTEECLQFEKLAKSTKKDVKKKFENEIKTLTESKLKEEKKFGKEKNVLDEITNRMEEVQLSQNILVEKEKDLKVKEVDGIRRDQATFALLTSSLNMKWDFTCGDDEVRGCFIGKDFPTPFHVNRQKYSQTQTANHLWDLVDQSNH